VGPDGRRDACEWWRLTNYGIAMPLSLTNSAGWVMLGGKPGPNHLAHGRFSVSDALILRE
jgi:hypothetical protein